MLDRFGHLAVFGGRQLYVREMRGMSLATRIVFAIQSKNAAPDWAQWVEKHPDENDLILDAARAAYGG